MFLDENTKSFMGPELVALANIAIIFVMLILVAAIAYIVLTLPPVKKRIGPIAKIVKKALAPFMLICFLVVPIVAQVAIKNPLAETVIKENVIQYKEPAVTAASASVSAEGDELAELILLEGAVLTKNDNLLPLESAKVNKINVFGWSSVSMIQGGSGSGVAKQTRSNKALPNPESPYTGNPRWSNFSPGSFYAEIDLYGALMKYGIDYNTDLRDFYLDHAPWGTDLNGNVAKRPLTGNGTLSMHDYQYSRLYEPQMSEYGDLLNEAKSFSDYAIVQISRGGGESNDSPKFQYKGATGGATPSDEARHYLEISTEEEDLLKEVGAKFPGKTIVIINSTNTMELGFMDTIPGLAACLVIGVPGPRAVTAVPKLLFDNVTYLKEVADWADGTVNNADRWEEVTEPGVNPSGRFADIQAYDFKSNPTWATVGHPEGSDFGKAALDGSGQKYYNLNGNNNIPGTNLALYPLNMTSNNFPGGTNNYRGLAYIDYMESIYVGYKWYETADKMGYWDGYTNAKAGSGKTGYKAAVQYPFGYGLSYSDFSWNITDSGIFQTKDNAGKPIKISRTNLQKEDKIYVSINVTNNGTIAGKEVVQLYVDPPYIPGGVEKSSANLVAFAKTQIIEPGKGEVLTLEFDAFDMASYDAYNLSTKVGSDGGYILEKGTYRVRVMDNSHDVGKGMIAPLETINFTADDDIVYDKDPVTGQEIKNRFTGDTAIDGIPIDGSEESTPIQYISRATFKTSFPTAQSDRSITDDARKVNLFSKADASGDMLTFTNNNIKAWNENNQPATSVTVGAAANTAYKIGTAASDTDTQAVATVLGIELGNPANYNDARWEQVLNQMTVDQMKTYTRQAGTNTPGMGVIGVPRSETKDGPNQFHTGGWTGSSSETGFPNATTLAQTFNVILAYKMGLQIGNDAILASLPNGGWLAPGINIHRTPFGSRNYEYYSEDAFLTGIMAAKAIEGARNKGIYVYIKHLALYDGDTNRDSVYTWVTEQALREIYLKPFQICIQKGGATGLMTAYNRVGAMWGGGSKAMETVVRDEMGFKGSIVTDWPDRYGYMEPSHAIRNGGDLFMGTSNDFAAYDKNGEGANNQALLAQLRRANKNVAYTWANAKYTASIYDADNDPNNNLSVVSSTGPRVLNFNWIQFIIIPLLFILAIGGGGVLVFFAYRTEIMNLIGKKKSDSKAE